MMTFEIIRKNPQKKFETRSGTAYSVAIREHITISDQNAIALLQILKKEPDILWILTPMARIRGMASKVQQ